MIAPSPNQECAASADGGLPSQELRMQRDQLYNTDEKAQAWSEIADIVKQYSDEMIQRWNSEIDTMLVFVSRAFL